ncbi:hypothetical protein Clacol_008862 [Clathrus columnatus]|uniref:Exocyst complex component Sec10-like alpha-helical bundle domain-containing protein n=1 Tax=Clathrus columnatus TaxID=1419009 RepID=A0AAV5AIX0_9AGAM|nr:hypothetical protein Clacol_008862 [Clathrus columnatus]
MDKWTILEPVRLYASNATGLRTRTIAKPDLTTYIGRLPRDIHLLVLTYLPLYQIPAYARGNRALSRLALDEKLWENRWFNLFTGREELWKALDQLETWVNEKEAKARAAAPPTLVLDTEDEFGDFASVPIVSARLEEVEDFSGFSNVLSATPASTASSQSQFRNRFMKMHALLKTLLPNLNLAPHLILSNMFSSTTSLRHQSQILHILLLYISPSVQPFRNWQSLLNSLKTAIDRFEAGLLTAFEAADAGKDDERMKEAAWSSWELWNDIQFGSEWEIARVWIEKQEIFYETGRWDSLKNFTKEESLDFGAMDEFITRLIQVIKSQGPIVARVFPSIAYVLLMFAERIATEVIAEYISPLLAKARQISTQVFLKATAASFAQSLKVVDVLIEIAHESVSRLNIEDVIYRMFEENMDDYLDEEIESVKTELDLICKDWERKVGWIHLLNHSRVRTAERTARFLDSKNPALLKRNVLTSFTNVLLLPVTIVPRTVGAFVTTGSNVAVNGIAMLNPQRWGAQTANGYSSNLISESHDYFLDSQDQDDEVVKETRPASLAESMTSSTLTNNSMDSSSINTSFDSFELLLSLDVVLELIHADREALKRVETFQNYPGHYGQKVRETIEELFILLLQALSERHISPGFSQATEQMHTYRPAEHEETTSVAPLLQFFELVHIGDTIQSMIQVYFDKEMAPHIDRTDFLNNVVREKKRFENSLDDAVAAGLNAGTEVLMNQVEHIILTRTGAREYYPQEGAILELGPTRGCREAITCLEKHCKLMRGSTSKDVLEVFYHEVGIRLHAIIQKHIKRQIISLEGGFQVIADLNAYHTFVTTLKIPQLSTDFSNLKMLGHVFIVSDAKDLAQIVRDVARYGGSFRPEDIYEFIQRRSDWKKIEKTVDKTIATRNVTPGPSLVYMMLLPPNGTYI